jgi:tyrosyl-tRNA synthetase
MSEVDKNLINDLRARGLIAQITGDDTLEKYLAESSRTLYCGFDPTADSLHIGSLVPLLTLKRFQQAGHVPIALVGGATGLIGDPSFKAAERKLNTPDVVTEWVQKLRAQVSQFIDFDCGGNSATIVNNLDWTENLSVLDFLRDVGKHFSVNNMIQKESVKQRIDREGSGISFTEFTYIILQSFDFAELYKQHNCTLQIGGSDQWGNITGGVDVARRMYGGHVFGMTLPLVTKADGTKFGKTELGTIWLDAKKTSPYAFYQFWLNAGDEDVYRFLRYFTFLTVDEIVRIEQDDETAQGRPQAQGVLAREVTRLVHGDENLQAAARITEALFSGSVSALAESDLEQLKLDGLPYAKLERELLPEKPLTQWLVDTGMAASGKQVKDALAKQAVIVNGRSVGADYNMKADQCFALDCALFNRFFVVRLGKKKYQLYEVE